MIAIWEILSRTERIDPLFWPAPSVLWDTAGDMIRDGSLIENVLITLQRILLGFVLGTIPGIALGLAMGLFWPARAFFMPISTVIYSIPKIAILPLMIIAFAPKFAANGVV